MELVKGGPEEQSNNLGTGHVEPTEGPRIIIRSIDMSGGLLFRQRASPNSISSSSSSRAAFSALKLGPRNCCEVVGANYEQSTLTSGRSSIRGAESPRAAPS